MWCFSHDKAALWHTAYWPRWQPGSLLEWAFFGQRTGTCITPAFPLETANIQVCSSQLLAAAFYQCLNLSTKDRDLHPSAHLPSKQWTMYPDVFNYIHPEFQISLDIMTHRCFWILFCHLWYSWKHQAIHHAVSLELNNSVFDISVFSGHSFSMDFTNSLRMVFTAASVCSQQLLSEFHWLMQHLKVFLKDCQKGQA